VLPEGTRAVIDLDSWRRPVVFDWLQTRGGVSQSEMLRTFNCGVGMVLCLAAADAQRACDLLACSGEHAWIIGHVEAATGAPAVRFDGGGAA